MSYTPNSCRLLQHHWPQPISDPSFRLASADVLMRAADKATHKI